MNFDPFKDWFYYSKGQRQGISVLILLIFITPLFTGIVKRIYAPEPLNTESFLREVALLQQKISKAERSSSDTGIRMHANVTTERHPSRRRPVLTPFSFDPNTLTLAEWDSMGMPGYISRSIRNFLASGGGFRYREDFRRIYLLEDWMYDELEAFIELPSRPEIQSAEKGYQSGTNNENKGYGSLATAARATGSHPGSQPNKMADNIIRIAEPLVINLNMADTTELQQIRGIGPAFSRRIVGYRELLGGYVNTKQLMEVYGLDSTRYAAIAEFVSTDTTNIKKINLNTADYTELVRHPYINRQIANAILTIRNQHGPYAEISELLKSYLIDDQTLKKLKPYLCVVNQ